MPMLWVFDDFPPANVTYTDHLATFATLLVEAANEVGRSMLVVSPEVAAMVETTPRFTAGPDPLPDISRYSDPFLIGHLEAISVWCWPLHHVGEVHIVEALFMPPVGIVHVHGLWGARRSVLDLMAEASADPEDA